LTVKDFEGYYYLINFGQLEHYKCPRKADKINPYTIQNIKLWCKLNNKSFELLSDKFEGAYKKLQWECLKDGCEEIFEISWSSASAGHGCPYCVGKKVGLSNCLATKRPDIALEWHPTLNGNITPYNVTSSCNKYFWWRCLKNPKHEWYISVCGRTNKNSGCPCCCGQQLCDENSLIINLPELAKEFHPTKNGAILVENLTIKSQLMIWWKCSKNSEHEWITRVEARTRGQKCPYCVGRRASKEYNLLICNPELSLEWDYEKNSKKPEDYAPHSGKKVWWKCKEGHSWESTISSRKYNGCGQCNESKGEKQIRNWLINNNIIFESQKEYDGLLGLGNGNLSYDFYLHDYNLLIEYQGIQHELPVDFLGLGKKYAKQYFKKQQEHDKRKKEYAKLNGYNFLEIWYWDFDRIEEILNKELK
jgi:hypothetical protein